MGPLAGLRVVELAHVMAGPVAGLLLADMGADVIKVERLPDGDDSRRMVPPRQGDESAAYLMMNRNKRGLAVDFRHPDGLAALKKLIAGADVLIENFRLGAMEAFGLGYETLKAENPRLIYCSISGFGRTGPYASRGGFDLIAQGMSGLMSITGEAPAPDGTPRPPTKVGAPVTDITSGILAALGIVAAVAARERSGIGQQVETSLFEAGIVHTFWQSAICFATGTAPGALGSAHPLSAPYQAFATADGWINVGAANQATWEKLCDALDAGDLKADPRFTTNAGRMQHLPALVELLSARFAAQGTAQWLEALEAAGVPAGPVLSIADMHRDPHAHARGMIVETAHPTAGAVQTIGAPIKFSETPAAVLRPAPRLGEHGREILRGLGYDDTAIARLAQAGAIRLGDGQ